MGLRAPRGHWLGVVVAAVLLCRLAHADDKPWAAGVSEADQQAALKKFQDGNASFIKDEWRSALDAYLEALKSWDHPNIRYNAAVCLIKLDRLVEAYEHLTAALRYGDAPLGKDLHAQGETYLAMLKKAVSHLEIVCVTPGVSVILDGERLDRCPDTRLVSAGKHQIVSEKPGYKTLREEVVTSPGDKARHTVELQLEGTRELTRRWALWKPWAVVAGGAVVGIGATALWFHTDGKYRDYNSAVNRKCGDGGCMDEAEIAEFDDQLSSANTWRAITYTTAAIGATAITVGFVLAFANTKRYSSTMVTPTAGPDRAGVTFTATW